MAAAMKADQSAERAQGQRGFGPPPDGPRWFVVQSHRHQERRALRELKQQGFDAYLPLVLGHPKSKNPVQPMFPGYLFARFDPQVRQWLAICSTLGVHDLMRNGAGKPLPMPDYWIGRMRAQEVDGLVQLIDPGCGLKEGDDLRVTKGSFTGINAVFVKELGVRGRIVVLVSLLGRQAPVELGLGDVEKAP